MINLRRWQQRCRSWLLRKSSKTSMTGWIIPLTVKSWLLRCSRDPSSRRWCRWDTKANRLTCRTTSRIMLTSNSASYCSRQVKTKRKTSRRPCIALTRLSSKRLVTLRMNLSFTLVVLSSTLSEHNMVRPRKTAYWLINVRVAKNNAGLFSLSLDST